MGDMVRIDQVVKYLIRNEERLLVSKDKAEIHLCLGKKLSLINSLLLEMDQKDSFKEIVEMLKKEVEEKFFIRG